MRSISTCRARAPRLVALCLVLVGTPATRAGTGPASLVGLGTLPGAGGSHATAVSGDGQVVVGYCGNSPSSSRAFRWTAEDGMTDLGALSPGVATEATAVNADGTVIVGVSGGIPFRWTAEGGMQSLGTLPGATLSWASGVSADGSIVVGGSGNRAFRWTSSDGMIDMGALPGGTTSTATAISADGSTVVGISSEMSGSYLSTRGFRWTTADGMVGFGPFSVECADHRTRPSAVSNDGSVIAGDGNVTIIGCCGPGGGGCMNYTIPNVFRKTGDSRPVHLQVGSPMEWPLASGVNGDGSIVVGFYTFWSFSNACAWDVAGQRLLLGQRFVQLGLVTSEEFSISTATDISDDGQTIVGTAVGGAWIAHIPVLFPLPGDINDDGEVDAADLLAVIAAWGPCPNWPMCPADIAPPGDPDGAIDVNDMLLVIVNWS